MATAGPGARAAAARAGARPAARRSPRRAAPPSGGGAKASDAPTLHTGERLAGRYDILASLGNGGDGRGVPRPGPRAGRGGRAQDAAPRPASATRSSSSASRRRSAWRAASRTATWSGRTTSASGEGTYFLTMEYVEGITVRELIDTRGRLAADAVLAIGSQLADALAVAHGEGVIHRDIKPQNLLLDGQGVLKVMDFGVARLAERGNQLTEAGLVVGTPAYMPPEQLLRRGDRRARRPVGVRRRALRVPRRAGCPSRPRRRWRSIAMVLQDEPTPARRLDADAPPALAGARHAAPDQAPRRPGPLRAGPARAARRDRVSAR